MGLPTIYNTYFIAFIATVGGMLFGFDISSMSAIINTEQYLDYFGTPTGLTQGAIGSALAAGSVVGSIIAGPISNLYGVCVGITSSQVPVYLAEIAKKEARGSLVIIQQLAIGTLPKSFSANVPN